MPYLKITALERQILKVPRGSLYYKALGLQESILQALVISVLLNYRNLIQFGTLLQPQGISVFKL